MNDGWNVILDVSLVSRPSAESWAYALRFADYAVTALFADISIGESAAWSLAACQRGEEEYQQGRGYGGRYILPEAIRALTGPAVTGARSSIRWVAIDDLEPYVPGSFDDVVLAYDLGRLSDDEYEFLAEAAACSVPGSS